MEAKNLIKNSSESEVEDAEFNRNAEVSEDTAIMVELDNEISFLSDFPDNPVSIESE